MLVVEEMVALDLVHIFFFKQKTAYEMRISDWSSDVCSFRSSRDFDQLCERGLSELRDSGFRPQYLAVRRTDLQRAEVADHEFRVLLAAFLGNTRLIDNIPVSA